MISNFDNVVTRLWECSSGTLSKQDLEWLADTGTSTASYLKNWSDLLAGVALLVASDARHPPGIDRSGAFSDADDLCSLLLCISDCFNNAQALALVAEQAATKLRNQPLQSKAAED